MPFAPHGVDAGCITRHRVDDRPGFIVVFGDENASILYGMRPMDFETILIQPQILGRPEIDSMLHLVYFALWLIPLKVHTHIIHISNRFSTNYLLETPK